ncbi:MAG: YraN family protein [Spirochaetaceae bacterium]|jgi:putative endonuclease|nr:YraN family protein [Spirochaetaceae bacterium]
MNAKTRGNKGEDEAALYLENAGLEVLERNFRTRTGEIDIIALDGEPPNGTIVFVEVKNWGHYGIENLEFGIDEKKQRKIIETAKYFLSKYRKYRCMAVRFDVIFIAPEDGTQPSRLLTHLVSAFAESI